MSFIKNPPKGFVGASTPGVLARNDSVTRNVPAASKLPTADRSGRQRRRPMRIAALTSMIPIRSAVPRTPSSGYSQLRNGLCSTSGRIPSASKSKNLKPPQSSNSATSP